jgi:hypothetical protein
MSRCSNFFHRSELGDKSDERHPIAIAMSVTIFVVEEDHRDHAYAVGGRLRGNLQQLLTSVRIIVDAMLTNPPP